MLIVVYGFLLLPRVYRNVLLYLKTFIYCWVLKAKQISQETTLLSLLSLLICL